LKRLEIGSINVNKATAKRGRGRPQGSKNKRSNLSRAHVRDICDYYKFNPAEKLIRIANNDDWDDDGKRIDWPPGFQARATEKLFDAIHNNRKLQGVIEGESGGEQITLAFIESGSDFALPGATSSEGAAPVLQPEQVQRAGLPSSDG
jgi:hypothetical protein